MKQISTSAFNPERADGGFEALSNALAAFGATTGIWTVPSILIR
jgi:hypothetical protein